MRATISHDNSICSFCRYDMHLTESSVRSASGDFNVINPKISDIGCECDLLALPATGTSQEDIRFQANYKHLLILSLLSGGLLALILISTLTAP